MDVLNQFKLYQINANIIQIELQLQKFDSIILG